MAASQLLQVVTALLDMPEFPLMKVKKLVYVASSFSVPLADEALFEGPLTVVAAAAFRDESVGLRIGDDWER